jgi:hypothetical protein
MARVKRSNFAGIFGWIRPNACCGFDAHLAGLGDAAYLAPRAVITRTAKFPTRQAQALVGRRRRPQVKEGVGMRGRLSVDH